MAKTEHTVLDFRRKELWTGRYRGVSFEIAKWPAHDGPVWNYYLLVNSKQVPDKHMPEFSLPLSDRNQYGRRNYPYMSQGIFRQLHWHGGITYYSVKTYDEQEATIIKVGCDYHHAWDEGQQYNIDYVKQDALRTIDELWDAAPYLMVWCVQKGCYANPEDGQFDSSGYFKCNACLAAIAAAT